MKTWTVIDRFLIIWKSDLSNEIKLDFFQVVALSVLLYRCTTWMLTKYIERKLNRNHKKMLRATLNKSWKKHPMKQQLYGHLCPISKTIQGRRTKHARYCWGNKDELISDVLLLTPTHWHASIGWPTSTYLYQLCAETECNL